MPPVLKWMAPILALALALGALMAAPAPAKAQTGAADHRPLVVATFSILGDMTREIGGDRIDLHVLVGPEGDAHTFQPGPADAQTLARADLVIANGLGFEHWLDRLVASARYKGPLVIASAGLTPREETEDGRKTPDPHAWQDPSRGMVYVRAIADALIAIDTGHAAAYRAAAEAYAARIADVDKRYRAEIAAIPRSQRRILTNHDAFGYLAAAFDITIIGATGLSTETEIAPRALARLIAQVRREGIRTLFLENMSDPRLMRQIATETGAIVGGTLLSDALAKPGKPGDTYVGMFDANMPLLIAAMKETRPAP